MVLSKKCSEGKLQGVRPCKKTHTSPLSSHHLNRNACKVMLLVALTAIDRGLMAHANLWGSDEAVSVKGSQKISNEKGGLGNILNADDLFGHSVALLGDVNGDGVPDLAVGAFGDDNGGFNTGAIYVLFLNPDGTVSSKAKISDTSGGGMWENGVDLYDNAVFGAKMGSAGDLDGDGVNELIVGNYGDDQSGLDAGAAWILFLNQKGRVREWQKITEGQGNFNGQLSPNDQFGSAVSTVGDIDGDGVPDLAIGAWHDDDEGSDAGALWLLFMNSDGTVKSHQKIPSVESGFSGNLEAGSFFGMSVARIGDIDGNGDTTAIAVGQKEAVWILSLDSDGKVVDYNKVDPLYSDYSDGFGWDLSEAGDIDYDGIPDLFVSRRTSSGENGEVWVLLLNADGTVKVDIIDHVIKDSEYFQSGTIQDKSSFGSSVALLGDVNGDGYPDVAIGAFGDDDGAPNAGAVWITNLIPPAKRLFACINDDYVNPMCITLRDEDPDNTPLDDFNKLELSLCVDGTGFDDHRKQLWVFDGSTETAQRLKPRYDHNLETCVETYDPTDGRLRVNPCTNSNQNTYNEFIFEKVGVYDCDIEGSSGQCNDGFKYRIHNAVETDYCVTNVGKIAKPGDPMFLRPCEDDRGDFIWTASNIHSADGICFYF